MDGISRQVRIRFALNVRRSLWSLSEPRCSEPLRCPSLQSKRTVHPSRQCPSSDSLRPELSPRIVRPLTLPLRGGENGEGPEHSRESLPVDLRSLVLRCPARNRELVHTAQPSRQCSPMPAAQASRPERQLRQKECRRTCSPLASRQSLKAETPSPSHTNQRTDVRELHPDNRVRCG